MTTADLSVPLISDKDAFFPCNVEILKIGLISKVKLRKRPVKLIKRVKIAHSFLQSVSDQFHVIIFSLPM